MGPPTNHTHLVELVAEQAAWYRQGKAIEVTMVWLEANMLWNPITDLVTALPDISQAGRTASLLYGNLNSGEACIIPARFWLLQVLNQSIGYLTTLGLAILQALLHHV